MKGILIVVSVLLKPEKEIGFNENLLVKTVVKTVMKT